MKIGVIGAGAWGTALANLVGDSEDVLVWAHEPTVAAEINERHTNAAFLPEAKLSSKIRATDQVSFLSQCDLLLAVTPAQHLRSVLRALPQVTCPIVLCGKGMETGTQMLMSEVAAELHPNADIAVLSGPTFAREVVSRLPTAVTIAASSEMLARQLACQLARPFFRPYISTDVVGAEIGGAVKNVLAIACGVVDGLGLGENARASLISRGFAEMARFGMAKGARWETLAGLSGLGDLILTCSSTKSRNFSLGRAIAAGGCAETLAAQARSVAEGAFTAPVLRDCARALEIEMPIVEAVCSLLVGEKAALDVFHVLMARSLKPEWDAAP